MAGASSMLHDRITQVFSSSRTLFGKSYSMPLNPGNHVFSVFVRRKDRIKAVENTSFGNDQRQPLEQTNAFPVERGQLQSGRERAGDVAQQSKRQIQSRGSFLLIIRGLSAQPINSRTQLLQLLM